MRSAATSIVARSSCLEPRPLTNTTRVIRQTDSWEAEGLDYHVAFLVDGKLRVSEIWDSREQFDAMLPRLMPVLAENGVTLDGEPEIYEVVNIFKR